MSVACNAHARHAAVGFDRQPQDHLALQRRIVAQLAVVEAIQRRLVAIEHDLNFFVGARERLAPSRRAVDRYRRSRDRARRARHRRTLDGAALVAAAADRSRLIAARLMPPLEPGRIRRQHRPLGLRGRSSALLIFAFEPSRATIGASLNESSFSRNARIPCAGPGASSGFGSSRGRFDDLRRLDFFDRFDLRDLLRRLHRHFDRLRFRLLLHHQRDHALRHVGDFVGFRRRQRDERQDQRERQTREQRVGCGLAEATVVFAALRPRLHRLRRANRVDLSLDDPLVFDALFFFERLEHVVFEPLCVLLLFVDFVELCTAARFDRADPLVERAHSSRGPRASVPRYSSAGGRRPRTARPRRLRSVDRTRCRDLATEGAACGRARDLRVRRRSRAVPQRVHRASRAPRRGTAPTPVDVGPGAVDSSPTANSSPIASSESRSVGSSAIGSSIASDCITSLNLYRLHSVADEAPLRR